MNVKNDIVKVIIIGDSSVGKTSLINKYIHYNDPHYVFCSDDPTIGVDMKIKYFDNKNNMKMYIWDTTGQERFKSIVTSYFRNAVGVFICYDVCNLLSFRNVYKWIDDIDEYCENPNIIKFLIATKSDVSEFRREVSFKDGIEYANKHNMIFFETSSKNGTNVDICFDTMANKIYSEIRTLDNKKSISIQKNDKSDNKEYNCLKNCSIL